MAGRNTGRGTTKGIVVVVALHTPAGGIAGECTQRKKSEKLNFVPTLDGPKSTTMLSPHRAN
eukprot:360813-Chlamydomonas_euryale.AAC.1